MGMSSLRSMVRMAVRARIFSSSPGIHGSRNAVSAFVGSRGTHSRAQPRRRRPSVPWAVTRRASLPRPQRGSLGSAAGRGARRLHVSRDEHADRVFAAMTVAASSAFAGASYWMKHADNPPPALILDKDPTILHEDPAMKTDAYIRRMQFVKDLYNKAMVDDEEEDPAMRARFTDWMEEYGRTYRDEEEKAPRFKLFKAFARSVDANNAKAAESGSSVRDGLTQFADWTTQEFGRLLSERKLPYGSETISDDEYWEAGDDEYLELKSKN